MVLKEPSHREDSFVRKKCLSENIIVDLRIISKLASKLNTKKRARVGPPVKCHLNGVLLADRYWTPHCVLSGFTCHDLQNEKIDR